MTLVCSVNANSDLSKNSINILPFFVSALSNNSTLGMYEGDTTNSSPVCRVREESPVLSTMSPMESAYETPLITSKLRIVS